jgi:arylsulfatase A-like enzyme
MRGVGNTRRHAIAVWGLAVLGALLVTRATPDDHGIATAAAAGAPNVLVIVTDDQRKGTMVAMPKTIQWLGNGGVTFDRGYVTTPSCCPSRASIFSGRYIHNHGVRQQGLAANLDHRSTIQRHLKEGGYFTAMAGKFLNRWNIGTRPPYFDRYAVAGGGYLNQWWGIDGTVKRIPIYTTTFIGNKAVEYLSAFQQANDAKPWFLYLATFAPHLPRVAEAKYADTTFAPWPKTPAVNEDVADKPAYLRWRPLLADSTIQQIRTEQLRTLLSVDDTVDRVMRTLQTQGELDNTLVIYLSDNGYPWGEHRLPDDLKFVPYTETVQVPFFARWPGHLAAGTHDNRFVANIDIKPTVLAAAGITPDSAYPVDGRSFLSAGSRSRAFTEYFFDDVNSPGIKTWASIRTGAYQYVENYDQPSLNGGTFREYYDLTNDPWMLTNLYRDGNPNNDPPIAPLSSQLAADRNCAGATCP